MYFVFCIIQSKKDGIAWKCSAYERCSTLQEAKEWIDTYRKTNTVLAAWIEDTAGKRLFECHVDLTGYVKLYSVEILYKCGQCGAEIKENDKVCRNCGQAVKWD